MGLVKVQKNKAYYKRLQTKYRRRREGKTDYYMRRKMITQAKNKYNTPKYRLVVRRTNTKIIAQVVYSTILGDKVLTQATSKELDNFDIPIGHTNYAACYATGLLIARRTLDLLGMADAIKGKEGECDAEDYHVEDDDLERRPFKVVLDVGLTRTISGCRSFGVLKGAVDGGLHIPHSVKKFPGYKEPEDRGMDHEYDASAHLERILGTHLQEYIEMLNEEDQERYKAQFSKFIESDKLEGIEDMYKECHEAIRAKPKYEKKPKWDGTLKVHGCMVKGSDGKEYERGVKRHLKNRRARVKAKLMKAAAALAEA